MGSRPNFGPKNSAEMVSAILTEIPKTQKGFLFARKTLFHPKVTVIAPKLK